MEITQENDERKGDEEELLVKGCEEEKAGKSLDWKFHKGKRKGKGRKKSWM